MSKLQKLTMAIILAVALALGLYDFWVAAQSDGYATISWVLWTQALKRPAIPFAFGFLMGHLFAQMPERTP